MAAHSLPLPGGTICYQSEEERSEEEEKEYCFWWQKVNIVGNISLFLTNNKVMKY